MLWLRVLVEGVVIVGSILLAFGIDTWWSDRQDAVRANQAISGLHEEFAANRQQLESNLLRHASRLDAVDQLLVYRDAGITTAPPDSLASWLYRIHQGASFDPLQGTLDGLLGAGRLDLVRDDDLRVLLSSWSGIVKQAADVEQIATDLILTDLHPWMRSRVPLPDFEYFARPGATSLGPDAHSALESFEFENLLVEYRYWLDSAVERYQIVEETLAAIIESLEEHMD